MPNKNLTGAEKHNYLFVSVKDKHWSRDQNGFIDVDTCDLLSNKQTNLTTEAQLK